MQPTRRRRAAEALLALLLLLALGSAAAPSRAAPAVHVLDQAATVAFPDRIVFTLEAQSTRPVTRVELRYRPLPDRVTVVARPPITPGTHLSLRYARDMRRNYLPPGIDIAYRWRFTFADGSWAESPERTFTYTDTRYRWTRQVRGPVELFSAVDDPQYVASALAVTADAVRAFGQRFAVPRIGPLRVLLYPSPEALRSALPLQSEEWIGGVALPAYRLLLAGVSPGPGASQELARILSHEVLHLVIAEATDNPFAAPPAWLDEGLATFYQTVDDPRLEAALAQAVRTGRLPTLRALGGGFGTDPERALLGYAASRSVVVYLLATYGEDGIARLLAAYRAGASDDEALGRSLGLTVDRLDRAWRTWVEGTVGRRPAPAAATAARAGMAWG
jgi:hypothetical protein